jgi:uncharacterized protein involved in exopolysaccharide biosynthesis
MNTRLSAPLGEERLELPEDELAKDRSRTRFVRDGNAADLPVEGMHELPDDPRAEAANETTTETTGAKVTGTTAGSTTGTATGTTAAPAAIAADITTDTTTELTAARLIARARLLWRHRVLLARALAVGLLAGVLVAWLIPSEYQSTVQLMPPDNPTNGGLQMLAALAGKSAGAMGSIAGDALGVKSAGSLFIGILRSRTVEDRLVDRFQLKKIYRVRLEENARKRLAENTGISEDRKSGIISLTVSDHDRRQAQTLATAYVEELNRLVAELSTSSAHRERVFLEERLLSVKRDLDQATHDLGEFSSQNATFDVKEQGKAMLEEAAALQGELIAAESECQALEAIYTPGNFRVRAAGARVSELRKQLRKLGGKGESNAIKIAEEREGTGRSNRNGENLGENLEASEDNPQDNSGSEDQGADSLYPSLRRLPLLGEKYADLYRRSKIEEAVFETLTQQYEVAKVQEAKETPSVKMLDEASLPEAASFPPRSLIVLLLASTGLVGAGVWVIARDRWECVDAADPKKRFSQDVLAGVNSAMPWAHPNGSRWQAATHQVWLRLARRGLGQNEGPRISQRRHSSYDRIASDRIAHDQPAYDQPAHDQTAYDQLLEDQASHRHHSDGQGSNGEGSNGERLGSDSSNGQASRDDRWGEA